MRDDRAGSLKRRYWAMLLLVSSLVLIDQFVIEPPMLRLANDAPTVNIAGRQRMLSQRLAKAALALDAAGSDAERSHHRDELGRVLHSWSSAHDALRHGGRSLSLPGRNSRDVRAAFDDIEPFHARMREAATRLTQWESTTRPNAAEDDRATILNNEGEYLTRMERIVALYEHEARSRVDWLIWTSRGVTATILIALVGMGWLILRPAHRLIECQVSELREARDALEARVLERTEALDRVNRELEHEVREHTLADERHRMLLEQFSHVGRTTIIGEMAGGLAHELNQPLGSIANYAEGCLVALEAPEPILEPVRAALEKILATTLRAGQIVKRIRRFVTRHGPTREHFEPNRIAAEVEEFFRDEATRRGITLRLELAPELPSLWGDPIQIQQVLVNLVRNAVEALSDAQTMNPSVLMRTGRTDAGDVFFSVCDNGEGIPDDRIDRVFDAYFSTRDEGMGMGLSISRTIVEAHHGRITVESRPGLRTTFRFTLPLADADDAGADSLHRG